MTTQSLICAIVLFIRGVGPTCVVRPASPRLGEQVRICAQASSPAVVDLGAWLPVEGFSLVGGDARCHTLVALRPGARVLGPMNYTVDGAPVSCRVPIEVQPVFRIVDNALPAPRGDLLPPRVWLLRWWLVLLAAGLVAVALVVRAWRRRAGPVPGLAARTPAELAARLASLQEAMNADLDPAALQAVVREYYATARALLAVRHALQERQPSGAQLLRGLPAASQELVGWLDTGALLAYGGAPTLDVALRWATSRPGIGKGVS